MGYSRCYIEDKISDLKERLDYFGNEYDNKYFDREGFVDYGEFRDAYADLKRIIELVEDVTKTGMIKVELTEEAKEFFDIIYDESEVRPVKRRTGTIYQLVGEDGELIELEESDIARKL